MRLHSQIWVAAFIRQVQAQGAQAMLTRRGESMAGAIYIKVNMLDGNALLYSPAPALDLNETIDRVWMSEFGDAPRPEPEIDLFLKGQVQFDADIFIVEVEDKEGRHFLGEQLVSLEPKQI